MLSHGVNSDLCFVLIFVIITRMIGEFYRLADIVPVIDVINQLRISIIYSEKRNKLKTNYYMHVLKTTAKDYYKKGYLSLWIN